LEKSADYFTLRFNGDSMYPFLRPGDKIVVRRVSPHFLEIGDIVMVPGSANQLLVHPLVKILPKGKRLLKKRARDL